MMFCICFFRQKKPSGIVKRDFAGKWGTTKPGSSFFLSTFSLQVLEQTKKIHYKNILYLLVLVG
jgi:hypothetical protein